MTEEHYRYRTSQIMLRNQFPGEGTLQIPIIPKAKFTEEEFRNLLLIGFDRTHLEDEKHLDRMVHFFLYDYKFERVWKEPDRDIERLRRYRAVLSPDFRMYLEMNPVMQLYNTFRNRWCGAYFAEKGMRVIPTVSWGNELTFDFCFQGIPRGSVVAVSTYMVSEHGNRKDQKAFFMKGYQELLNRVEPQKILCYHTPFPEMEGDIVYIDYDLSSWRYQEKSCELSPYAKYISGELPLPQDADIIIKRGYVAAGMGSAYGAEWKPDPKKPQDRIFLGPPNTIQRYYLPFRKGGGYWVTVKYDSKGRSMMIRHETNHAPGSGHSNPHDHQVTWNSPDKHPEKGSAINYPEGAPDLKQHRTEIRPVEKTVFPCDPEALRFRTVSEFKTSIRRGAEVVLEWDGKEYGIWPQEGQIRITCSDGSREEERFASAEKALEYRMGADRLRDVITRAEILDRTL